MLKEAVVTYMKLLLRYLSGVIEEDNEASNQDNR
jgi:hypothetical protein